MASEIQFTEDLASRHDEASAPDGLLCATADGIVYTLHLKDDGHHLLLAGGACVPHWVREWRPSGLPGEWPNKLTITIRYCHPHIAKGTEHAYSNDVVDTPLPVEPEQTPTAQPRSYRFDYKPGEWREPEQVVDESALASLEGKPAVEWVEVETVLTDCRVEYDPDGSIPSPMGSLSVITGGGQPVRLFTHTRPGSASLAVMKIHEEITIGLKGVDLDFVWSIIWDEQNGPARVEVHADAFAAFVDCSAVFGRLAEWHDHDVRPEHVRAWLLELGYRELS